MKPWLLITFTFILLFSCENEKPIPENLKIASNYLDKNWVDSERKEFNNLENKAVPPLYYGYTRGNQVNVDTEVEQIKSYWRSIEICKSTLKVKALSIFNKFAINYSNIVKLTVNKHSNAIDFKCPNIHWNFRENKDLIIEALILNKKISIDSATVDIQIKLLNKNKPHTEILLDEYYKGDVFNISLNNSWKFNKGKTTNVNKRKDT